MHRRWLLPLPLALAALVGLPGCALMSPEEPPATPLAGTEWLLVELSGQALPAAGAGPRATLRIDGEPPRAIGNTGVNNFVGTAQLDGGDGLRFGPLATTRRAGAPEAMQLEQAYLAALGSVRRQRTGPGSLELLDDGGRTVARFATASPPR
jgi:heat shock protein HslJ